MKRFTVMILLLCMLLPALPAMADDVYYGNMEVINCNEWVSLRENPSTSAKRLVKVPLGAVVTDCQQYGENWIYAVYEDDQGYIQAKYLRQCEGLSVYSAMLISDFDSVEDMNAYLNDPRHKAVSALCKSIRENRSCVDYEID